MIHAFHSSTSFSTQRNPVERSRTVRRKEEFYDFATIAAFLLTLPLANFHIARRSVCSSHHRHTISTHFHQSVERQLERSTRKRKYRLIRREELSLRGSYLASNYLRITFRVHAYNFTGARSITKWQNEQIRAIGAGR